MYVRLNFVMFGLQYVRMALVLIHVRTLCIGAIPYARCSCRYIVHVHVHHVIDRYVIKDPIPYAYSPSSSMLDD